MAKAGRAGGYKFMPRETSEITEQDLLFLEVGSYVRDKIAPEDLKEFIAYLKTYTVKRPEG